MKLKTRLITAFFVIACVPLMLAVIAFAGFSYVQVNALKTKLGITGIRERGGDNVEGDKT